jgi:hypothetical protein
VLRSSIRHSRSAFSSRNISYFVTPSRRATTYTGTPTACRTVRSQLPVSTAVLGSAAALRATRNASSVSSALRRISAFSGPRRRIFTCPLFAIKNFRNDFKVLSSYCGIDSPFHFHPMYQFSLIQVY